MKIFVRIMLIFMLAGVSSKAFCGDKISAQDKVLAQEAALANAYVKLVENIKGCNVEGFTVTSEAVTEFLSVGVQSNAFVKGARVIDKGCDDDGFAWAIVKISIQAVIENLESIQRKLIEEGVTKVNYKFEKELIQTRPVVVTAVGFGAARNVSMNASITPSAQQVKWPLVTEARSAIAKIKAPCTTQDFVKALRRAESIATLNLAREVKGVDVSRKFFTVNDITAEDMETIDASAFVKGATLSKIDASEDGVVSVSVKLRYRNIVRNTEDIIRNIKGERFKSLRIEEKMQETILEETGTASCIASESGGENGSLLPGSIE